LGRELWFCRIGSGEFCDFMGNGVEKIEWGWSFYRLDWKQQEEEDEESRIGDPSLSCFSL